MIDYEEFKEQRDDLRRQLREWIAAKSLDRSDRGAAVRAAHRKYLLARQAINGRAGQARDTWQSCYSVERYGQASEQRRIRYLTKAQLPGLITALTSPRKIDQLIGNGGWDETR